MPNALLVIALAALYVWCSVLSVFWMFSFYV